MKATPEAKIKSEDITKRLYPRHIWRCYILLGLLDYMQIMFRFGTWIPTDLYNSYIQTKSENPPQVQTYAENMSLDKKQPQCVNTFSRSKIF